MDKYNPAQVEPKWQKVWEEKGLDVADIAGAKRPFYNLMMFPYPSAEGLHVGNMYAFTASDIYGRFKRMQGLDVFEPIGLDGFGIHSENYALKIGRHPAEHAKITEKNFYGQLHKIGAMYDWSRTLTTYDPDYYRWTQWIFVKMWKSGLAYRGKADVNFCPKDKTVLSDEQVIDGKCERCGTLVEKREMEQWFFRITKYGEKLLSNLDKLDWSEKIKVAQRNWIGKKEGVKIKFGEIEVFTTRPETIFGATFVVLSPNHPWAGRIKAVLNPANNKEIPVFVNEYVLGEVGTGAIMGVPAYDERDLVFAKKNNLPIVKAPLTEKKFGQRVVTYHLRDWLISRQRYWGPPIPMIYCENCASGGRGERKEMSGWYSVSEDKLPVELPYIKDYQPEGTGKGPLANHPEFYKTTCPGCKHNAVRETDVSDTFLDSAWYELRYPSVGLPTSGQAPFDKEITKKWLPVDMYTGGAEHAVLHLMYSRFVTMVLHDLGYLDFEEPFNRFFAHGLLIKDGAKMSKSRGNVVNPDQYIVRYGADALRLYLMFMGPVDQGGDFRDTGMEGMRRWVDRVWAVMSAQVGSKMTSGDLETEGELGKLVVKASGGIEKRRYNVVIAKMMEFVNFVVKDKRKLSQKQLEEFILVLAPFAPHLAEELWQRLHGESDKFESVHQQKWPIVEKSAVEEKVTVVVTVDGKPRTTLEFSSQEAKVISKDRVMIAAQRESRVMNALQGRAISRVVYVPGRIINFVTKGK